MAHHHSSLCFHSLNLLHIFSTHTILSSTSSQIAIVIHHNVITLIPCPSNLKMINVINIDKGTLSKVMSVSLQFIKKIVIIIMITIIASLRASVTFDNHSSINQSCLNKSVLRVTPFGSASSIDFIFSSICAEISKVFTQGCLTIRSKVHGFQFILASHLRLGSVQKRTSAT